MAIDKQRVGDSFGRHFHEYHHEASVQRRMSEELDTLLGRLAPQQEVARALEIGIGTGFLTRLLTERYPQADWWFNDLSPAAFDWIPAGLRQACTLAGDAENLDYPPALDLLASASALQWFDDIPAFFHKAARVLRPQGLLAIASFGPRNFIELKELLGNGLAYPSLEELQSWARAAGLRILAAEEWEERLLFPNAREILAHLRSTGVNALPTQSSRRISSPAQLRTFDSAYRAAYSSPTQPHLPLSYHPLLLLAQR